MYVILLCIVNSLLLSLRNLTSNFGQNNKENVQVCYDSLFMYCYTILHYINRKNACSFYVQVNPSQIIYFKCEENPQEILCDLFTMGLQISTIPKKLKTEN